MTTAALPTVEELRARIKPDAPKFDVPADAKPMLCRSCGAMMYMVRQPSGKLLPVDVLVEGGVMPRRAETVNGNGLEARVGRGVAHFATCPQGKMWSGAR